MKLSWRASVGWGGAVACFAGRCRSSNVITISPCDKDRSLGSSLLSPPIAFSATFFWSNDGSIVCEAWKPPGRDSWESSETIGTTECRCSRWIEERVRYKRREAKSLMTEVFRDVSETLRDKNNICKFRNTYILRDLFKHWRHNNDTEQCMYYGHFLDVRHWSVVQVIPTGTTKLCSSHRVSGRCPLHSVLVQDHSMQKKRLQDHVHEFWW